jgi:hypothetical protein
VEKADKRINIFVFLFAMLSTLLSATSAQAIALISDEETEVFLHQTLRPVLRPREPHLIPDEFILLMINH